MRFKKNTLGFISETSFLILGFLALAIPVAIKSTPTISSYISSADNSLTTQIAGSDSPLNAPIESTDCPNNTAVFLEQRCDGQKFDATKANNKVYCGKQLTDVFTCGGKEIVYNSPADKCSKDPWCPSANTGTTNPGTGGNSTGSGTLNSIIRVVTNGAEYASVSLVYRDENGNIEEKNQTRKSSDIYTFSLPTQTGTFNISVAVYNNQNQIIKDSAETCKNTGGSAPHDCKVTVTNGGTTTQNFTLSLDPQQTSPGGTTPIPSVPAGGQGQGVGEICTSENTICGGSNSNSCLKAKDGNSLRCCRFTERFCEGLNRCVAAGTIEFQNCGKVFSTPTPGTPGFDAQACSGAPGSPTNHCNAKNAANQIIPCCPGYREQRGTDYCACVPNTTSSTNTSQTIASASECSRNSDCKLINKSVCVLNNQNIGTCE